MSPFGKGKHSTHGWLICHPLVKMNTASIRVDYVELNTDSRSVMSPSVTPSPPQGRLCDPGQYRPNYGDNSVVRPLDSG